VNAAEHAARAAQLLDAVAVAEQRIAAIDPEEHLELAVRGGISRFNADQKWTVELAVAHALTAVALTQCDEMNLVMEGGFASTDRDSTKEESDA
jgi:hypothetical protein